MKKTIIGITFTVALFLLTASTDAQTTAFNFQGRLNDAGNPANGNYEMQFTLFDAVKGGAQVGPIVTDSSVSVINGSFTTVLDFGAAAFSTGEDRYLEIGVRPMGSANPFTLLSPLQQIKSTPYSIQAKNAATADNALSLGGVSAKQFVQTNDARLADDRNPLPNSPNYIQNTTKPQTAGSFNIDGNGTAGSMDVNGPVSLAAVSSPGVAPAGKGRIYFDTATNKVKVSENGSAFVNLVGATGVSGSGTVNSLPLFTAGTTLGSSLISQSGSTTILLPNSVSLAATASGNNIAFGSPNSGTGMTISGPTTRADVRLDGTTMRLNVGPAGNIPSNGISIDSTTVTMPAFVSLAATASGNNVSFGSPNSGTGMTIGGATARADVRLDGTVMRLAAGAAGAGPPGNGIAISGGNSDISMATNAGNVTIGSYSGNVAKLMVAGDTNLGLSAYNNSPTNQAIRGINLGSGTGVYGESNGGGIGVYGTNSLSGGTAIYAQSQTASGTPLRADGKAIFNGNLIQDRDKGGVVKSMLYITFDSGSATIVRCFDSVTNSSSSPCATVANRSGSFLTIGYPYQIDDRFLSITPIGGSGGIASISGTQIVFLVGSGASGSFFLYIY